LPLVGISIGSAVFAEFIRVTDRQTDMHTHTHTDPHTDRYTDHSIGAISVAVTRT